MFEMTEFRNCSNCKWWELDKRGKFYDVGVCQCYDKYKKHNQYCCRHKFEHEEVCNDEK